MLPKADAVVPKLVVPKALLPKAGVDVGEKSDPVALPKMEAG